MGRKSLKFGNLSKNIGQLLREQLLIPQVEIAKRIGVSEDTVSRWLNGSRPINIEDLVRFCEAANLDVIDLIVKAQADISDQDDSPEVS
jgi:transcriptional regulator with XRE-family HTH domain